MSQYPISTPEGLYEAVNYLASGPAGLGQNFAGFSSYEPVYLRPGDRQPFTVSTTATTTPPPWYVAPIPVTNAIPLNVNTATNKTYNYEIFFTPQAAPPFVIGTNATVKGVIDSPFTDNYNGGAPVVVCTTSSVILQTNNPYELGTYVSGGTITKDFTDAFVSTDCNGRVFVTGPTDRVFLSAQINLDFTYTCSTSSEFDIVIRLNRNIPTTTATPAVGTDYLFNDDKTISQVITHYNTTSSGTITMPPTIFTSVIDQPSFGYFWYILQVSFNTLDSAGNPYPGDAKPGVLTAGLRSLTAQVVKQ